MTRDDSTMTSLRELLALETARLEAERTREIEHAQALAREAQRAREASERLAAEALEARERDARARRERESAVESARQASELEARLRVEHEGKLRAIDVALAAERAEIHAKALQVAAKRARAVRGAVAAMLLSLVAVGGGVAWVSARMDASIRAANERAQIAALAARAARENTAAVPVIQAPAAVVQAPVAPALAQPANARPARPRPNWRSNASTNTHTTTTNDPFSQLSNIDRGAGPINGTDR